MPPGLGVKLPSKRTRTGCLTCRKRKVKCDEEKPNCARCVRLLSKCVWQDPNAPLRVSKPKPSLPEQSPPVNDEQQHAGLEDYQVDDDDDDDVEDIEVVPVNASHSISTAVGPSNGSMDMVPVNGVTSGFPNLSALEFLTSPVSVLGATGDTLITEFPSADRFSVPYLHHFISFCSRFLAYPNDAEGNPFQKQLVPLAVQSPALYHAMAALAAGHMARGQPKHTMAAMKYYTRALGELNDSLAHPEAATSNSVLGACLLLCVYEITHSDDSLWFRHLQGARDLIVYRGGPKTSDFLVRFFSLLDISGSLLTGEGPLIPGNYWLEGPSDGNKPKNWPFYDDGVMVDNFHALMVYMAQLSNLSNESMTVEGQLHPESIAQKASQIRADLLRWWDSRPPVLRDQSNNWRHIPRDRDLSFAERLEEESFSSTRSVVYGCIIYLHHILDPFGSLPQEQEVADSIQGILEIAKETPEGMGLEMGLFFGLFMAGIAIYDDLDSQELIRRKLTNQSNITIYHADHSLVLLEALWMKQRHDGRKYDWRELQKELGLQIFILA